MSSAYGGVKYLAIDPGASTGWALYTDRTLTKCGACAPHAVWSLVGPVDRVLYEKPEKYPNDGVSPGNLITLAVSAGIALGCYALYQTPIDHVAPKVWKGNQPKSVCHGRSWTILTDVEREVVRECSKGVKAKALLDLLDAVALGQWALQTVWR